MIKMTLILSYGFLDLEATSAIPSLNDDCAVLILSMLDKASLHAIANTSSAGCAAARRFLVRDVILHSFDHAATFCRVVLASDLAHLVKRLIIEKPIPFLQHKNPGALEKFASNLASVLEGVQGLDAFALESFAGALLRKEPRIAIALLAQHPRHLSLNGADGSSLLAIRYMSGIADLSLVVQDTSEDCSPAISSIIENSSNTLQTLTLKTPLPDFLTSTEMDIHCCQYVRTILMDTGRNMDKSILRRFSLTFPNLQRLSTAPQSFALRASDRLQDEFLQSPLNALTAVSGDVALIAFLAQYHSLRYIKSTDVISVSDERRALMERLFHCPVQGAKLSIWADIAVRGVLLDELAHALPQIKFFAIAIQFVTLTNLLVALESVSTVQLHFPTMFVAYKFFLSRNWFSLSIYEIILATFSAHSPNSDIFLLNLYLKTASTGRSPSTAASDIS